MSPLSQKLSELRPFSWVKSWQNLKSKKFSNLKISLTFWAVDQFFSFLVKSIYISESTHQVSRSNNNLEPLNWVWALCAPPALGNQNPGANRVKGDNPLSINFRWNSKLSKLHYRKRKICLLWMTWYQLYQNDLKFQYCVLCFQQIFSEQIHLIHDSSW